MIEYRNAKYDAAGTITCELNHPVFGWVPFTADPSDVEAHGRAIFAYLDGRTDVAPYVVPEP